jgi:hypothetical protein
MFPLSKETLYFEAQLDRLGDFSHHIRIGFAPTYSDFSQSDKYIAFGVMVASVTELRFFEGKCPEGLVLPVSSVRDGMVIGVGYDPNSSVSSRISFFSDRLLLFLDLFFFFFYLRMPLLPLMGLVSSRRF